MAVRSYRGRSRSPTAPSSRRSRERGGGGDCSTRAKFASVRDIAEAERIGLSYISRVLRLTLLAPDIMERVLDGRPTADFAQLMKPFPVAWDRPRQRFP
jgi:hypothetical protein